MYLKNEFLILIMYIVLSVSVQTKILNEETVMLANNAQNTLNLTHLLNKRGLKYEHHCILVYKGTNLKYKEDF